MRVQGKLVAGLIAALFAALLVPSAAGAVTEEDNQVATSFDGTTIVYKLFLPDGASANNPVPVVLRTHGWGGSHETSPGGFVGKLLAHGYAVLTWDQRGFGQSGGMVEIDDPDFEAKDVEALIDKAAADPRIAQEAPGDPRVGMSGGSYAGGIQFVTAAADPRVDAIAPEIAWNNLIESLTPNGVLKTGWDLLLYGAGQTSVTGGLRPDNPGGQQTGSYDPQIHKALVTAAATGELSQESRDWFSHRGPDYLLDRIQAPVFIINATTDMLFPPSQAVDNFQTLAQDSPSLPLKMQWYCGGHGSCSPFNPGDGRTGDEIVGWFDRYVKEDASVDTGARFEYLTDDGVWHSASDYPVPGMSIRTGSGSGIVSANSEPTASGLMSGTPTHTSLEIPIPSGPGTLIGQPTVRLTETGFGTGAGTDETTRAALFFQIVNKTKNEVVGNQVAPRVVATDGQQHTYEFPIEGISYTVDPGDQLVLQVVGTSAAYEPYRGAAAINLESVQVDVPVAP